MVKRITEEAILNASRPSDIFSMNADTIEQEKETYLERFKPKAYSTIKNFILQQHIIMLYRQALNQLGNDSDENSDTLLSITDLSGKTSQYYCHYAYDIKIGKMYVTEKNIIYVINSAYKKYYDNYIEKTKSFPKLDKNVWKNIEYSLPKVSKHFQTGEGNWVIFIDKPCRIYPLREILNYFNGKLKSEYVASILTRLYNFVCYTDLVGLQHNGITLDNLFFAPGRTIKEGESFTVDDMRIVGIYGGWFFATWSDEKLNGVPKEVFEILPHECKQSGFSSFKVDELSIKRVARELLGDSSGDDLINIPESLLNWVTTPSCEKNAYEEFCKWEKVIIKSFGKRRFVEMDVSID